MPIRLASSARKALLTLAVLLVAGISAFALVGSGQPSSPTLVRPTLTLRGAKYVRGYLVARIGGAATPSVVALPPREIFVPGVTVTLTSNANGKTTGKAETDLSGRFDLGPQKAGSYKLCWHRNGFRSECLQTALKVLSRPVNTGILPIRPDIDGKRRVSVWGEVRRRDGDEIRLLEPAPGVNRFATVEAIDGKGVVFDKVAVNNFGDYLVPAVPVGDKEVVKLAATVENGRTERGIYSRKLASRPAHRVDLVMRNRAPKIREVVASVAGVETLTPGPGDVVDLVGTATDGDGDPVEISWTVDSPAGSLSSPTGHAVSWQAPTAPGAYAVYVVASDGKGGYDKTKLITYVGQDETSFSGRVTGKNLGPLAKVEVEINGKTTQTDSQGFFRLAVTPRSRYVLNLRKPGFALVSHVYRSGLSAGRWTMTPVTVATLDPGLEIRVRDDSRKRNGCAVPASTEIHWKNYGTRQRPRPQDGKGNTLAPGKEQPRPFFSRELLDRRRRGDCGPGTEVVIPANSLVDENGNPPAPGTLVDVAVGTIDLLDPDSMPGDYSSTGPAGQSWMVSYGAGSVEITASGKKYNLRRGAKARLRIPVADVQLAAGGALPPTIPRLVYNEKSGIWKEEGELKLDATGRFYEADVPHFSTINADVQKQGQSCVRFKGEGLPTPFRVEVVVPLGAGQAPRVRDEEIPANDEYWAIVNLPNNTEITLTAYQPQPGGGIPYGVFTVNTGGAQTGNPTAPFYFECVQKVVLTEVEAPEPGADAFLHGLYSFAATNLGELAGDVDLNGPLVEATINYYGQIDPRGLRKTFAEFKATNGLDAEGDLPLQAAYLPEDEVRAAYANGIDLGFGRDMHGKRTVASDGQFDVVYYVSNYGDYDSDDEGDFEDAVAQDPTKLVATVAMEWSRIEDPPVTPHNYYDPDNLDPDPNDPNAPITFTNNSDRTIKFYVYDKNGNPLFFANLDGRGQRPIPQLCMVCHGGVYPAGPNTGTPGFANADDVKLGSLMLPFDLHGYVIAGAVPAAFNKANQQLEFAELNRMVIDTQPGTVTTELINAWYAGDPDLQDENIVVPGWNGNAAHRDMYLNVIKPACRVCHSTRPLEDLGNGFSKDIRMHAALPWLTRTNQGGIATLANTRVCAQRVMPHALATYNRFWGSFDVGQPALFPFQPSRFKAFLDGQVEPALAGLGENVQLGGLCAPFADPDSDDIDPPITLSTLQTQVFDNYGCSGCHAPPFPNFTNITMDLGNGQTHGDTVGVNAQEASGIQRINDFNSGASYLLKKVTDNLLGLTCTGVPVANCGDSMPPGSTITADDAADLAEWIDAGAINN